VNATTRDIKLLDELETEGREMRINDRAVVVLPWLVLVVLANLELSHHYRSRAPLGRTRYATAVGRRPCGAGSPHWQGKRSSAHLIDRRDRGDRPGAR
jgi:hypothetical protein